MRTPLIKPELYVRIATFMGSADPSTIGNFINAAIEKELTYVEGLDKTLNEYAKKEGRDTS